jgi:type 1 fimbria pilin
MGNVIFQVVTFVNQRWIVKLAFLKEFLKGAGVITFLVYPVTSSAIQCDTVTPLKDNVMTIAASITVGADMPVGTVIYKAQYVADSYSHIKCNADTYSVENWLDYLNIPGADTGLNFPNVGKVYATNLPGLGVAVTGTGGNQTIPRREGIWNQRSSNGLGHAYYLQIVKTGDVSPGVLNGSSLPSIKSYAKAQAGYTGLPFDVIHLRFAGTINVISKTCKTPDVDVNLGRYEVTKYFKGKGSTTPWIDSSITLTDCPAFKGYYGRNNSSITIQGSGTTPSGTPDANSLSVSLKPVQQIVDATNGVMAVSAINGENVASGVGIQIGWGSASGSPTLFNFNESKNYSPPNDGRSSFKIPLAARYIQTDSVASPGRADGKAIFLINYY